MPSTRDCRIIDERGDGTKLAVDGLEQGNNVILGAFAGSFDLKHVNVVDDDVDRLDQYEERLPDEDERELELQGVAAGLAAPAAPGARVCGLTAPMAAGWPDAADPGVRAACCPGIRHERAPAPATRESPC